MSWKKVRPKVRGKKDVLDEMEIADIDRDEQKAGIKRREKRWKKIELKQRLLDEQVRVAKEREIMKRKYRVPNRAEESWLKCDYYLNHVMEEDAYDFMYELTVSDPETYKKMFKVFVSPYTLHKIDDFVQAFATGSSVSKRITIGEVVKRYRKIKKIRSKITIKHKNGDEYEL